MDETNQIEIQPKRTLAGKRRAEFLGYLRECVPFASACALVDFTPGEVKKLMEGERACERKLSREIEKAQAQAELTIIAKVMASNNARDSLALLQARYPHWSPKSKPAPAPSAGKQLLARLASVPESSKRE